MLLTFFFIVKTFLAKAARERKDLSGQWLGRVQSTLVGKAMYAHSGGSMLMNVLKS